MSKHWHHLIDLTDLPKNGIRVELRADQPALDEIAERLSVPKVTALSGVIEVNQAGRGATLNGHLSSQLTRICVSTLKELEETVNDDFVIRFSPDATALDNLEEITLEDLEDEPLPDGPLDLADLLVQQLALAMDPYPRRDTTTSLIDDFGAERLSSPFDVLKDALKEKNE